MTFDEFRMHLTGVTGPNPKGWYSAKCPGHPDREASLSLRPGTKGATVVLKCHAGCTPEAIVTALGLTLADLFFTPSFEHSARFLTRINDPTVRKYLSEIEGTPPKKAKRSQRKTSKKQQGGRGLHHPESVRTVEQSPPTASGSRTTRRRRACRSPSSAASAA